MGADLVLAVLLDALGLVEAGEAPVVALVQPPVLHNLSSNYEFQFRT